MLMLLGLIGLAIVFHKLRSQNTARIIFYILVQQVSVDLACAPPIVSSGNNILFFSCGTSYLPFSVDVTTLGQSILQLQVWEHDPGLVYDSGLPFGYPCGNQYSNDYMTQTKETTGSTRCFVATGGTSPFNGIVELVGLNLELLVVTISLAVSL